MQQYRPRTARSLAALAGPVVLASGVTAAQAASLPAASYHATITVGACGGKTVTLTKPGAKSVKESCTEATGSERAALHGTPGPSVSNSQTSKAGTANVDDSGTVGMVYFFEVLGPARQYVPVVATFTGALNASGSGTAGLVTLYVTGQKGNKPPTQYTCGLNVGTIKCGNYKHSVTVKLTPFKTIQPDSASLVEIDAGTQGVSNTGGSADSSSASAAVNLTIPKSFPHRREYKLVFSKGVGDTKASDVNR